MHKSVRSLLAFMLVSLLWQPAAKAISSTYYVAPNGSVSGDGSLTKPWPSVNYALDKVGGGSTIIVRPGIYTGPIYIKLNAKGTQTAPTIIRAEVKWGATISNAPQNGIFSDMASDFL